MDMDTEESLQQEINVLRIQLQAKESLLAEINSKKQILPPLDSLTKEEIGRFSRQIILPDVGVKGQLKIRNCSVLIVGVGGLGCPAATYLVGAGIGSIGLVDYDLVEISNLHRQLLHNESTVGETKSESAKSSLQKLYSACNINVHNVQIHSLNALELIEPYDIVLDATDNVATRYLLNDACVMLKKPLVSGSALQLEGQLTVYNYMNGPCYRCIFPIPPPPETVTNCGDGGVLGAVPGVIGTLQALEALKIILELEGVLSGRLLLFDGSRTTFRTVKLRGRRVNCDVCSDKPIITRLLDYEEFCGMRASDKDFQLQLLEDEERVSVYDFDYARTDGQAYVLIDVRNANEYEICHIPDSLNLPIKDILDGKLEEAMLTRLGAETLPVYVVCRRGNDSQLAVKRLQSLCSRTQPKDIIGGLHSWARNVDLTFPIY